MKYANPYVRAVRSALSGKANMINLFQFWNTPTAPKEVEDLLASWEADPAFNYRRFNTETAEQFIEKHFDDRTLKAFRKCKVPAMQADFFRYCALFVHGGVYVDADTKNSGRLPELLHGRKHGLLMTRETRVANDFLYVCDPHTDLYRMVIERAIENVEGEISNNVWMVTGPGIMTGFFHEPDEQYLLQPYDKEPARIVREYVLFQHDLKYKKSDDDWRSALGKGATTIFNLPDHS